MVEITDLIGPFGRWQGFFLFFASFRGMLMAFHNLAYVFLTADEDSWCSRPEPLKDLPGDLWRNISRPDDEDGASRCTMYNVSLKEDAPVVQNDSIVVCSSWEYETEVFGQTLNNEFDLVCDSHWTRSILQSSYMATFVVSVILMGIVSDRFGRKVSLIISTLVLTVSTVVSIFSPNYFFFLFARTGIAFGMSGLQVSTYSLLAEVVGPTYRIALNVCYGFGWTSGLIILPWIVKALLNWRHFQIVCSVAAFILMLMLPLLIESPRWLLSTGRKKQAYLAIKRMAKFNNIPVPDLEDKVDELLKQKGLEHKKKNVSAVGLLRTPLLRRNTLIVTLGSFISEYVYYGVAKSTISVGGDPYVNFALSALFEGIGYSLSIPVTRYVRRKPSMMINFILFGLTLFGLAFTPEDAVILRIILVLVGRTVFTLGYTVLFIFDTEFFPTVARSSGIGFVTTIGNFGGVAEPLIREVVIGSNDAVILSTYGFMSLVFGVMPVLLPETFNQDLPDTIQEGENFCKNRKEIMTTNGVKNGCLKDKPGPDYKEVPDKLNQEV